VFGHQNLDSVHQKALIRIEFDENGTLGAGTLSTSERTQNPHWVVVFKGLITTHHLMCYGNEVRDERYTFFGSFSFIVL
jgi:hypothetical protein